MKPVGIPLFMLTICGNHMFYHVCTNTSIANILH